MLSNPRHQNCPLHITLPTQPTIETPFLAGEIDTVETSVIDGWVNGELSGFSGPELGLVAEAIDQAADRLGFLGKKKVKKAAARIRAQAQQRAITRGVTKKVAKLIEASAAAQAEQTKAAIEKALADKAAADQAKAEADRAAAEAQTQAEAEKARVAAEQAQAVKDAADTAVKAALATQQAAPVAPGAPGSLPAPVVSPLAPLAPQAAPYYPQLPEAAPAPQAAPYYPQLPEPAGKYAEASTGVPIELEDWVDDDGGEAPELEGYLGMLAAAPTGPVSVEVKPSAKPGNNIGKIALAAGAGIGAYLLWRKFRPAGPVQGRLF